MKFNILHTNDIHSRFEAFAKISSRIKDLRDENTLVLDAGDFNDFMRIELQGTLGRAGGKLLEKAGYDAIAIGNNEGFQGIEAAETLAASGKTVFLSSNLYKYKEGSRELAPLAGVKRSIIIKRGGTRFLIVGASPFGSFNQFFELLCMHSEDVFQEISREIQRNQKQYDICILLSHCGIDRDREIAERVEGIDIIIGGHSHTLMDKEETVGETVIHQSGNYGEYLGVLTFEVENKKVINACGRNLSMDDTEEDEEIISLLMANKKIAIKNLDMPLYFIKKDLWHDVVEENPISNFLADALKTEIKCDIALINSGVLNGGIRKGKVSKKKLLEICPSPLNPTYFEIQGKHLLKALNESLKAEVCMKDGKGSGFRGKYLGRLHVSGSRIEYDEEGIKNIYIGDKKLEVDKWYSVASSDYLQRGTGYIELSNNRNLKYNVEYLRDTLREHLVNEDMVDNAFSDRYIKV